MKTRNQFQVLALTGLMGLAACTTSLTINTGAEPAKSATADDAVHWGYEGAGGPQNWAALADANYLCAAGIMQSPIDLSEANALGKVAIKHNYAPVQASIEDNGHTIQANFAAGLGVKIDARKFKLLQVHFHTPSEHVMAGSTYPIGAHFVHATDAGELLVLGILFTEGEANPQLATILDAVIAGDTSAQHTLDPTKMIPSDLSLYRYMGSLTTPPCSEGVNWHVVKTPVSASTAQIAKFTKIMGGNARPVQPLNGRLLLQPK